MRAIIVDDEPQSHLLLQGLLATHPQVEVVGTGQTVVEGRELIQSLNPAVVFLDIEMPEGTGFDLLRDFPKADFKAIFITAYNEYALTAIKFGALDYLLKPITQEDLFRALSRVPKSVVGPKPEQLNILFDTLSKYAHRRLPTRIAVPLADRIEYLAVKDILRLEAQQNYSNFHLTRSRKILVSLNLGAYVKQFQRYHEFMRVHRSHLVNLLMVDQYVKSDGGYLVMKDGSSVSISKIYKDRVLERLRQL